MNSYRSYYPNQVHQLSFYISKNYYILKNGEIKYQQKKFDINWKNYSKTNKKHIVNFVIRDHFSNCFYAETFPIDQVPHIKEFLFNAWRKKQHFRFCGVPDYLICSKHMLDTFPELKNFSKNTNLIIQLADQGFSTGVRATRDWEENYKYFSSYENLKTIEGFQEHIEFICRDLNTRDNGRTEPNLKKWIESEPKVQLINDKMVFETLFKND
ncbi:hypothetical protein SAMN05421796_1174 [Chryseobacterium piscicola]|uniref:Uncharacterized protein n=1 Tax=Chryseobacterium piscicola TaxID=551459 RepID=A0A1N7PI14_9FLAO|nr:hypothetical protein [Chryseobacterium piscicola]PQA95523.1 hypothetical protein B0A70_05860 [Chryseobacterium piscicola]SIT10265.1 hypothetical protein SAMN05421796_1174 [Chryseobacterium piscicola]